MRPIPMFHPALRISIAVIILLSGLYAVLALVCHSYVPSDFLFLALGRTWSIDSAFVRPEIRLLSSGDRIRLGIMADANMRLYVFLYGSNKVMATLESLDSIQVIDPATGQPLRGSTWITYRDEASGYFMRNGVLAAAKRPFGVLAEKSLWLPTTKVAARLDSLMKLGPLRIKVYSSRGVVEVNPKYGPSMDQPR
jgi:hypothetical protein